MKPIAKNQEPGFTLIELLIVIAIIGILSAIGLISFNGARERSRDTKRKADLSSVRTALNLYYDSFNAFPHQATFVAFSNTTTVGNTVYDALVSGKIIGGLPAAPLLGENYYYRSCDASIGADADYTLYADLEKPMTAGSVLVFNHLRGILGETASPACPLL